MKKYFKPQWTTSTFVERHYKTKLYLPSINSNPWRIRPTINYQLTAYMVTVVTARLGVYQLSFQLTKSSTRQHSKLPILHFLALFSYSLAASTTYQVLILYLSQKCYMKHLKKGKKTRIWAFMYLTFSCDRKSVP